MINQKALSIKLIFIGAICGLMGCQPMAKSQSVEAVIRAHSDASLAELQQIINTAMNQSDVLVAKQALTDSSRLVIERDNKESFNTNSPGGREMSRPEVFQLTLDSRKCVLTQLSTQKTWPLTKAKCIEFKTKK